MYAVCVFYSSILYHQLSGHPFHIQILILRVEWAALLETNRASSAWLRINMLLDVYVLPAFKWSERERVLCCVWVVPSLWYLVFADTWCDWAFHARLVWLLVASQQLQQQHGTGATSVLQDEKIKLENWRFSFCGYRHTLNVSAPSWRESERSEWMRHCKQLNVLISNFAEYFLSTRYVMMLLTMMARHERVPLRAMYV